jgi:tRNA dimethylallyltransferase
MEPRIWLIAGPTASGKSALALRLAEATGGEIVNADALQLYADLRVLTARPDDAEMARAPHHLFGAVDAAEGWSVGRWLRAARAAVEAIVARGHDAIVVGGTGLYFRALTQGLAEIPEIPVKLRQGVEVEFEALGEAGFRARLAGVDPGAAARISPGDRQRLARAWEVFAATGKSLTDHHATSEGALPAGSWRAVTLEPPRDALYARCDARLEGMIAGGALAEVQALMDRNLDPALPAMKAVGVQPLAAHLRGETSLEAALIAAQQDTRHYAKRQLTWARGQTPDWPRLTDLDADDHWRQFLALNPDLTT